MRLEDLETEELGFRERFKKAFPESTLEEALEVVKINDPLKLTEHEKKLRRWVLIQTKVEMGHIEC